MIFKSFLHPAFFHMSLGTERHVIRTIGKGRSIRKWSFASAVLGSLVILSVAHSDDVFPDKALAAAVRQEVFAKRYNEEPLTAEDVAKISRVVAKKGEKIKSLEGLQHCKSIMDLDVEDQEITDVGPIRELVLLQKVTLAGNAIESLEPLSGLKGMQYLEVSRNKLHDIEAVRNMPNLRSLYIEENQIKSLAPIAECKKLWSLYASKNPIEDFSGIGSSPYLDTVHLDETGLSDVKVFQGLKEPKSLSLMNNKIEDLAGLLEHCKADVESRRRFAPFLRLRLAGNPLSENAKTQQIDELKKIGVRLQE